MDQHTVKTDFLRRIYTENGPFRTRIKTKLINDPSRIRIPEMIKYHYKNRPHLQPSIRDIRRFELLYNSGFSHEPLVFRKTDEIQIRKLIEKSLNNSKQRSDIEKDLEQNNSENRVQVDDIGENKTITGENEILVENNFEKQDMGSDQNHGQAAIGIKRTVIDTVNPEPPNKRNKLSDCDWKDMTNLILNDIKSASINGKL